MANADISALGTLNAAEPLDLDMYTDAKEAPPLPKKGRYTVQAPDSFQATSFGATKAGFLSAQVDPIIIGPTNEGYTIRFTKVSAKPFLRSGSKVSQLGDYLRATGMRQTIGGDPQDQADAVAATSNAVYEIFADWRAYNKNTGFSIEGMEKFPSDGNGGHLPWIEDPTKDANGNPVDVDDEGKPVRLRANLVVTRYLAAS